MSYVEGAGILLPAFLAKLWNMLEDPSTNDLIAWSDSGQHFIIKDQVKFSKELLPKNFKHNNMNSMIRQLNKYGFHKVASFDQNKSASALNMLEYSHPNFRCGYPQLLKYVKGNMKFSDKTVQGPCTLSNFYNEVRTLKDLAITRFSLIEKQNNTLQRKNALLRINLIQQQKLIDAMSVAMSQPQLMEPNIIESHKNYFGEETFVQILNKSKDTTGDSSISKTIKEEIQDEFVDIGDEAIQDNFFRIVENQSNASSYINLFKNEDSSSNYGYDDKSLDARLFPGTINSKSEINAIPDSENSINVCSNHHAKYLCNLTTNLFEAIQSSEGNTQNSPKREQIDYALKRKKEATSVQNVGATLEEHSTKNVLKMNAKQKKLYFKLGSRRLNKKKI